MVDVLARRAPGGQKVAIIGAGGIGFDVAEFLVRRSLADAASRRMARRMGRGGSDPTVPGGVVKPKPPAPLRQITLLQRKVGKPGAGLARPPAGSIAPSSNRAVSRWSAA